MTPTEISHISPDQSALIAQVDAKEAKHPTVAELNAHIRQLSTATILTAHVNKPISVTCNTRYHAFHVSGYRPLNQIWWVVMHATEGGTSQSVASYFTSAKSGGSTQLVVDDFDCYRCLSDAQIPWGAPGANYHGFHIEQCGYVRWTKVVWSKTHRRTLMRAAYKAALHCKRYGIPIRFVEAEGLKKSLKGITTHAECTKAFGGDHTDPGTNWPRLLFMTMVRAYALTIKVKRIA